MKRVRELTLDRERINHRRILDLTISDKDAVEARAAARRENILIDDEVVLDPDGSVVAIRLEYVRSGQKGYYFAFLIGYDEAGQPLAEPTMDDVEEAFQEEVYRLRWELVNNPRSVSIMYGNTSMGVESVMLIEPDMYGSGKLVDNHELRRLAIEQGVFKPFPL